MLARVLQPEDSQVAIDLFWIHVFELAVDYWEQVHRGFQSVLKVEKPDVTKDYEKARPLVPTEETFLPRQQIEVAKGESIDKVVELAALKEAFLLVRGAGHSLKRLVKFDQVRGFASWVHS